MSRMGIACGRYTKDKGITRTYIAKRTGITVDKISKSFNGARDLSADELMTICALLGVDPIEIGNKYADSVEKQSTA